MTPDKARAVVIRAVPFGETSAVVTLFTREFGKVRALAKGAWRPKSAFDGALDLLSSCQVLVLRKQRGGLDLVTEAFLERRFRVASSLAAVHAGMYVAELLDALTADADPQPELFDAADTVLWRLSGHRGPDAVVWPLVVGFELSGLRAAGQMPAVSRCAECGVPPPAAPRQAFGMLDGGLLCPPCRRGRRSIVSVSSETLAALAACAAPIRHGMPVLPPFEPRQEGEVRAVMNTLVAHVLGRRSRLAPRLVPSQARR